MYFFYILLLFTDAPLVSLSLGAPLDPYNLMKGSDVYLECDIKANPAAKRVEWFQNVSVVCILVYICVRCCIIRAEYLSQFHLMVLSVRICEVKLYIVFGTFAIRCVGNL